MKYIVILNCLKIILRVLIFSCIFAIENYINHWVMLIDFLGIIEDLSQQ